MIGKSGLLAVSMLWTGSMAGQICNLVFNKCPGDFTAGITVPSSVIWLDPVVPVCSENIQVQTGNNSPPPSIVFIIDNSGSMGTSLGCRNCTDPNAQRFKVTTTLLDSIFQVAPATEVGLVIFSRKLAFDDRDNPFFKTAFPGDATQHDAYVPLTKLNQTFANGETGLDTLKALLSTTPNSNGNLIYNTTQPDPRTNKTVTDPLNVRDGTDITLGFQAAKLAMASATASKDNQFFIFLSDGAPSAPDDIRQPNMYDFEQGTGVPTTFTVFFTDGNSGQVPGTIDTMTTNIKANGYSGSNPKSTYFPLDARLGDLLSLLENSVLNPIFANTPGKPLTAVMSVGGKDYNSTGVDATNFTFGQRVPLAAGQTAVNLKYTYQYTDSGKIKTKDVPYTLNVTRADNATLPDGITEACQDQGNITLYNNGNPINVVTADHTNLDVHLTLATGESCNSCTVEVKPNKSSDHETLTLTPAAGYQTANFQRETSTNVVPNDGKLEHLPTDSIIVTYVNPDNPLDVIRKAFPYSDVSTQLTVRTHNDVAHAVDATLTNPADHFILVTPTPINATPQGTGVNWVFVPSVDPNTDSTHYVGNIIEASRAFDVEIQIYSNLGQFVNKIHFSVPQSEFNKLVKGTKNNTRQLRVLWDNRSKDGSFAGTGAYIFKTTVTLLKIPGIAEEEAISSDYRIVGVLRSAK